MANKRLNKIAARIGAAAGKADRTAHKFAKAGGVAQEELKAIAKQVEALQKQLRKTTVRLKKTLA
jgi:seryl-tRNA synthetase